MNGRVGFFKIFPSFQIYGHSASPENKVFIKEITFSGDMLENKKQLQKRDKDRLEITLKQLLAEGVCEKVSFLKTVSSFNELIGE